MALDPVINFGKVTVSIGYNASDTSIVLTTGHGANLPATFSYNLVWWDSTTYPDPADDPNVEIVRVTNRVTDTLTVVRAQEGTSATVKNIAGKTYKMILAFTKKMKDDIGAMVAGGVIRAVTLRFNPGATPGTNINIIDVGSIIGFNRPTINNATDLVKNGTSGSFSLNADGSQVTMDITENIIGILSTSIQSHKINSSSTTEMYVSFAFFSSNNLIITLRKRGSTSNIDLTTILDAGDQCDVLISFITNS